MSASEQTEAMLWWWRDAGVGRADLAVRRPDGTMIWHRDRAVGELPLPWIRAENVRRSDVYIRPARGYAWPLVFLDDLPVALGRRVTRKYAALVVMTSVEGGCHLWLRCARALSERERGLAQRYLAGRIAADRASTSGEHLGRLAGFKNWKRGGSWVNVLPGPRSHLAWDPSPALQAAHEAPGDSAVPVGGPADQVGGRMSAHDTSASGREWGWVCGLLQSGHDPSAVLARLVDHARPRRGRDADRYAQLTLRHAISRTTPSTLARAER